VFKRGFSSSELFPSPHQPSFEPDRHRDVRVAAIPSSPNQATKPPPQDLSAESTTATQAATMAATPSMKPFGQAMRDWFSRFPRPSTYLHRHSSSAVSASVSPTPVGTEPSPAVNNASERLHVSRSNTSQLLITHADLLFRLLGLDVENEPNIAAKTLQLVRITLVLAMLACLLAAGAVLIACASLLRDRSSIVSTNGDVASNASSTAAAKPFEDNCPPAQRSFTPIPTNPGPERIALKLVDNESMRGSSPMPLMSTSNGHVTPSRDRDRTSSIASVPEADPSRSATPHKL
jgi:hypothetical protein